MIPTLVPSLECEGSTPKRMAPLQREDRIMRQKKRRAMPDMARAPLPVCPDTPEAGSGVSVTVRAMTLSALGPVTTFTPPRPVRLAPVGNLLTYPFDEGLPGFHLFLRGLL